MPVCAAIDIGSNALRLKIAECTDAGQIETLCEERVPVRLGVGAFSDSGRIPEALINEAVEAITRFKQLMNTHEVERLRAVATSALRDASNRKQVLRRILDDTGIELEVISGSEEARLIQLGAQLGYPLSDKPVYFLDIGGGSVEVSLATASDLVALKSFRLGEVRLTEMFLRDDPPTSGDLTRLAEFIEEESESGAKILLAHSQGADFAIGTGGCINAIAEVIASGRSNGKAQATAISRTDVDKLAKQLRKMRIAERARLPGINRLRAETLTAGTIALAALMKTFGINELHPSDRGLRDGVLVDMTERSRAQGSLSERIHARRRRYARHFAKRFGVEVDHSTHVAKLCAMIFDQLQEAHGLGGVERDWLEAAAIMHEVGMSISFNGYHKHSHYIISNAELIGFTRDEIRVIAAIARYHRKAEPANRHEDFRALTGRQRRAVEWLSAILRVGDGLDRQRNGLVSSIEVRRGTAVRLMVKAKEDISLDLWTAQRRVKPLEKLLGASLKLVLAPGNKAASARLAASPDA